MASGPCVCSLHGMWPSSVQKLDSPKLSMGANPLLIPQEICLEFFLFDEDIVFPVLSVLGTFVHTRIRILGLTKTGISD